MTRAILWDLDGTLIDSEAVHFAAIDEVLAGQGLPPQPGLARRLNGLALEEVHAFCVGLGLSCGLDEFRRLKLEAYIRRASALRPRPALVRGLVCARARGFRQAVVSNSERVIVDVNMGALALPPPCPLTLSRDDVRRGKPDPEPYETAAMLLGVAPGVCIVVEDSAAGMLAGIAAGMNVLALVAPGVESLPVAEGARVVRDERELLRALGLVGAA